MTNRIWKFAGLSAMTTAGLLAQSGVVTGTPFQQVGQMSDPGVIVPKPVSNGWFTAAPGGRGGPQVVVGKPFSGTEERKTVQTLGDGTQIESSDSDVYFRDSQGRTRVEQTVNNSGRIVIVDPVEHVSIILNPGKKTAIKTSMATVPQAGVAVMRAGRAGDGGRAPTDYADGYIAGQAAAMRDLHLNTENLGVQTINGVAADGTRMSQTIAAGKIGNNRDIHIVNERWYSNDLQMLVKTVNSDPRFGVTTYQMTNIVQGMQDPSLFQIPADYTVTEPAK
ncbi:MAG TPA: hypothetical protein VKU19_40450 [Bryobacteraceae bacterium]|nr:hypothetical protein [Bryobacteraceae bacterium]